jgi:3'(2'), 5'-bisphosphate nucleotidase
VDEDGLHDEHRVAVELAGEAGSLLMELRSRTETGKARGAEGDRRSHRFLTDRLADRFPDDRVRSEEADRSLALDDDSGRVWIVDPLDGTREYSEGREDWAVHVALAVDGEPRVGAVALPALGLVLGTGDPPGPRPRPRRPAWW